MTTPDATESSTPVAPPSTPLAEDWLRRIPERWPQDPKGHDLVAYEMNLLASDALRLRAVLAEIATYKRWVYETDDGSSFATRCSFAISDIHALAQAALNGSDAGAHDGTR